MTTSILLFCLVNLGAPADYGQLKTQAEGRYAEGSYALALELYTQARALALGTTDRQWVEFRYGDTLWRSQAGSHTYDSSKYEESWKVLNDLLAELEKGQGKTKVWAEVLQSLGDYRWLRPDSRDWYTAWQFYQRALEFWAASSGDEARVRYLGIVLRAVEPPGRDSSYYYGYYGNTLPVPVAEKALKLAKSDEQRCATTYILGRALRDQGGSLDQLARIPDAYEAVLKLGRKCAWYDDALYEEGLFMESTGRVTKPLFGSAKSDVDYVKAVELYKRLRAEFKQSESRYWDDAGSRIEQITRPVLSMSVSNIFLPESELQLNLSWRNVKKIELAIYGVDLADDVQAEGLRQHGDWLQSLDLTTLKRAQAFAKDTQDKGDYKPGSDVVRLQGKLPVGAYIVEATAGGLAQRDFILVTDATLVLKSSGRQALVYFCNALDGSPIAKAKVSLWYRDEDRDGSHWVHGTAETREDGLANFSLERNITSAQIYAAANREGRQAFATGSSYRGDENSHSWRVYAFTDRPAYRPKETMQWKAIAREFNGRDYTTPANQKLVYEIYDPRGSKVSEGFVTLNAFGSAWGSLALTEAMVLGEYRLRLYTDGRREHIGDAVLFRLEEYKLPEFVVSVKTPETGGKPRAFKAGDKIEAEILVEYYFGGGVANAQVDAVVQQKPFYPSYVKSRDYPWLYNDNRGGSGYYYGWGGYEVVRQSLKTDAKGIAKVTFTMPDVGGQNTELEISARVVDSSRREVNGSGRIRVSPQPYFIYANARHAVHAPGETVMVDFKALDANDGPAEVQGTVTVTREVWQPKSGEYVSTKVAGGPVKTDRQGDYTYTLAMKDEGFYRVRWQGGDAKTPIVAEATVYVGTPASQDLGFHADGFQIILDKDDGRLGETVKALIVTPTPGHWVLFSVEASDIYSYELTRMTGNTRLVDLKIDPRHAPNVFLVATLVQDRGVQYTSRELVVPPLKQYVNVELKTDGTTFEPRAKAKIAVTTRDETGKPLAAEVSLGLVDESVYAIQAEYAGDPRQLFWSDKRSQSVQLATTFNHKSFVRLVKGDDGQLIDAQTLEEQRRQAALENQKRPQQRAQTDEPVLAPSSPADNRGMEAAGEMDDMAASKSAPAGAAAGPSAPRSAAREESEARPSGSKRKDAGGGGGAHGGPPTIQVRSDFRATAFWKPDVTTDENGRGSVEVQFPDSLTSWKGTARAVSKLAQFGIGTMKVKTQQPLMVRLQGPRFFVVGDKLTISAIVNNYSDKEEKVAVELEADGLTIDGVYAGPQTSRTAVKNVTLAAGAETRVDWKVSVQEAGDVRLKVTARGGTHGDAMEKKFKAWEHGVDKMLARGGKLKGPEAKVTLDLPPRREGSTRMTVQVTASLAAAILDALPYLVAYPYGCTEQTMSRFLPTVIARRAMKNVGLDPQAAMARLAADLQPVAPGRKGVKAAGNVADIDAMVEAGLKRLYDFQHSDGGWGWWKADNSDRFMTAYVLWGLSLAREAGVAVKADVLSRGASYLRNVIVEDEVDLDRQAWILQALGVVYASAGTQTPSAPEQAAIDNLWKHRDRLNTYGRALLTLALKSYRMPEKVKILVQNLENGAVWDKATDASLLLKGGKPKADVPTIGVVHWGADGTWWHWYDSPIETTSFALKALIAADPEHRLIDPTMNWLLRNRRGAEWTNTRDTSLALLALTDYLNASGETKGPLEFEVLVNGKQVARKTVLKKDVLKAPSTFEVDPSWVKDGANEIVFKKLKGGALYFFARADFFSLEEPITAAGHELFVKRQYFKQPNPGSAEGQPIKNYPPLDDNGAVKSGDRIEVILTVETKNDYEYLLFEDLKPAGFEALEVKSGESLYAQELKLVAAEEKHGDTGWQKADDKKPSRRLEGSSDYTGRTAWVYQELRDRKVALFVGALPQGIWEIHYTLRAEVPGRFHALPVLGHAMYVPDVRANGDEIRVEVKDVP